MVIFFKTMQEDDRWADVYDDDDDDDYDDYDDDDDDDDDDDNCDDCDDDESSCSICPFASSGFVRGIVTEGGREGTTWLCSL